MPHNCTGIQLLMLLWCALAQWCKGITPCTGDGKEIYHKSDTVLLFLMKKPTVCWQCCFCHCCFCKLGYYNAAKNSECTNLYTYQHNIEKDLKTVQIVSECILNFNYYNAHNLTFSNFWTRDFDVVIYVNIYFSLFKLSLQ